ncbi:SCY1-like protein 2 [Culicoides brevitarsis]|uniref:SCY1-like protein 2 n=1 Tax=Culicoides brevitarsis TaxID=469753 RepID=UPI00307CAD4B
MDVINKLYSSVSSTVSQLSGVLPGNPVTREFEAEKQIASAGRGLVWKIYKGYKKSTKQEAAIFVMEKRMLDKWSKDDRDSFIEQLKRSVIQLTKIRHPQILTVQHPLEESRESLAFATEPVFASLANVLGDTSNLPSPNNVAGHKLFDIEIKYGLMQLAEGIGFLHSDVKLLHRNICPESIIVNKQGAWKIFGFDYCAMNQPMNDGKPYWPLVEYNSSWHVLTQPSLEFMAPEYGLISSHSPSSDIFSLGILIYTIYSRDGKPPKQFGKDYNAYKRFAADLKQGKYPNLSEIPEQLVDYVKLMLNATPEMRPNVHEFVKIPFFEDVGVKTLSYLDSLFQWDNLQKSKFYKGLPQIIQKLPHRINLYRINQCLVKEFLNPQMVPFVLPNVLMIADKCSQDEYLKYIFPHLKPVMKMQDPIQILLIFMQKMELLLRLTPAEDVKSDVLPMLYRALESDAQQIQELCLSVLPTFASLIDYPAMKNALMPRIMKLCLGTGFVSVRVNCLLCIGKLLDNLDKWLVLDDVLPFLSQIPSREPAVIMAILGIYKLCLNHNKLGITKEVMANKIIPFLVPLSIENGLSVAQFNAIMSMIKEMVQRIETEHRSKLEQLNSIKNETKEMDLNLQPNSGSLLPSVKSPPTNEMDKMFSDLGLDGYMDSQTFPENSSQNGFFSPTTPSNMSSSLSSGSLSLQDKQRMVAQQEMNQRLQTQAPIMPSAAPQKQVTKPKDLTSTLIESNLSQMRITPTTNNQPNWQQPANFASFGNAFPSQPAATTTTNWNTTPSWNSTIPNSSSLNSLNSLMPMKNDKIPMNQMQKTLTSPIAPSMSFMNSTNNNSTSTTTNVLSKDDIMDFLN